MPNKFEDAMKGKIDAGKYIKWKKQFKDGVEIPKGFMFGQVKYSPYINTACDSSQCIYDLKQLEKEYEEANVLDDTFEESE